MTLRFSFFFFFFFFLSFFDKVTAAIFVYELGTTISTLKACKDYFVAIVDGSDSISKGMCGGTYI